MELIVTNVISTVSLVRGQIVVLIVKMVSSSMV